MQSDNTDFYLGKDEPLKSCLLALRDIILAFHDDFSETKQYGMPCFCYRKKPFCYLWVDKKTNHPYILMVEGRNIHHPALVQGDRARMKILMIDPGEDIPVETISVIFNLALNLYRK